MTRTFSTPALPAADRRLSWIFVPRRLGCPLGGSSLSRRARGVYLPGGSDIVIGARKTMLPLWPTANLTTPPVVSYLPSRAVCAVGTMHIAVIDQGISATILPPTSREPHYSEDPRVLHVVKTGAIGLPRAFIDYGSGDLAGRKSAALIHTCRPSGRRTPPIHFPRSLTHQSTPPQSTD
jgi:hypothetical protein